MEIRKATANDVAQIQQMIQHFAEQGLMLPRSEKSLYENLQGFMVAVSQKRVVGTGGLHVLWKDLAEIRSLAVHPDSQGHGIGRLLVEALVQEAKALAISQVLSLTYQIPFFNKLDFQIVQKESLPHKIWKDCIHCKKFYKCDETAMIYYTQSSSVVYAENVAEC